MITEEIENLIATEEDCSKLVVVIPAFNEERFIGSVVIRAQKYTEKTIVVDDGSSDATADIAESAGAIVLRHTHNQGKGAALNTGLRYARELEPDIVITLDADGQHMPEELVYVAAPILLDEADIVVGSRYLDKKSHVPRHRVWGHIFFNFMTNRASGVRLSDSQSGFRAFSPRALERILFHSNGFSVESEMQFLASEQQLRMIEVPITITYQDKPKRPVWMHGLMVLNGVLHLVGQYRPLLFFGLTGLLLIIIGSIWGLFVLDIYRKIHVLAMGYTLISVVLFLSGMMMLFTGIILHSIRGLLLDLFKSRAAE